MENKSVNSSIELDQLIASSKDRLRSILDKLGWTIENTLKETPCAKFKEDGRHSFDKTDPPLPESFDCKNSIVIDETQLQSIFLKTNISIPQKFSDIQLNFSREQKCKLYEYVIANTAKTSESELKVSFPNNDADNSMTFAEIVAKAKKKDKKIQRKYRTSKPTHIEEVRNLVYLQMKALDEYFHVHSDRRNSRSHNRYRNRNTDEQNDTSRLRSRSRDRTYRDSRSSFSNDRRNSSRKSRSRDKSSKETHKRKKTHKSKIPKSHKKHKHKEHKHHRRR